MAVPIAIGMVDALVSNTSEIPMVIGTNPGTHHNKSLLPKTGGFFIEMASVYILHSKELNRFYIGSCNDLSYRIGQHINKEYVNSFTTKADDWQLFFFEDNLSYGQARAIEQHIKKMKSVVYINNIKSYPEIMEKLKEEYQ